MGFLKDLGGAVYGNLKEWSEEIQEYYREGMSMSE